MAYGVNETIFVGVLDSALGANGFTPDDFGSGQDVSSNRIATVNAPGTFFNGCTIINQNDLTGGGGAGGFDALNVQSWTTNSVTVTIDAAVFPSIFSGLVAEAHHIGTGDLAGTNNGPIGALITSTLETAAHVSAVTGVVIDIGNSGGGTIDQATSIWIPSIGDPGSTITKAVGLYVAPQIAGAAATYAIYIDGTTQSFFGGTVEAATVVLDAATPTVTAGQVGLGTSTSATATSGSATLPGNPVGFLEINIGGTVYKLPYYNS